MEERLANRPELIPEKQFKDLLEFWDLGEVQEISAKNKQNRQKQCDMHTMGPSSLAMLRHELQQNDPDKREPSQAEIYIESRKRKVGHKYKTQNEETLENIEKMKALKSVEDGNSKSDPYFNVITKKEHSGRLRLYGRGVTKSKIKRKDVNSPFVLPPVFLDSITQHFEQKLEEKVSYILSKIQEANPGIDIVVPELSMTGGDASTSRENLVGESTGQRNPL